ncbi:hypothetical protein SB5_12425 [Pseudomonas oryzihabitans]|nr:hypothetical protein SB5_12425 [Pseudomonas psychrotolerans]
MGFECNYPVDADKRDKGFTTVRSTGLDDSCRFDACRRLEATLDLSWFNTNAIELKLIIQPAKVFQCPINAHPPSVAGSVEPARCFRGGNKPLRGFFLPVAVATADAPAGHANFADSTYR